MFNWDRVTRICKRPSNVQFSPALYLRFNYDAQLHILLADINIEFQAQYFSNHRIITFGNSDCLSPFPICLDNWGVTLRIWAEQMFGAGNPNL